MKRFLLVLLLALPMVAQDQPQPPQPRPRQGGQHAMMQRMRGPRMDGKWWTNTELAKKLNLTDQQVSQMEQIFQQSRLKLIDQRAAVEKAEATLQPMLEADRPDEAQVLAQIDKVAQARAELEKAHARMLLGIRQVLTGEQWKQLKAEMPGGGMPGMRTGGGFGIGPTGGGSPGLGPRPGSRPQSPPPPEQE